MKAGHCIAILLWMLNAGLIIYAGLSEGDTGEISVVDSFGQGISLDSLLPSGRIGIVGDFLSSQDSSDGAPGIHSQKTSKDTTRSTGNTHCVNINSADALELISIKGIGPVLASKIVQHRTERGFFKTKEDLLGVKGIGPAKMVKISDQICF